MIVETESHLFAKFTDAVSDDAVPVIFILGSPRTGSTLIYQMMINFFECFYLSNFICDHFPENPAVGTGLDVHLHTGSQVSYESSYGKTAGPFEPSEGSPVFSHWFGGGQPSQVNSARVLPDREDHMIASVKTMHALSGRPVLFKNAWNCFRIPELIRLFPRARFVWIRRDIVHSALSDLESRIRNGGPNLWNSATTTNFEELRKRPYWEQVIEQQFEYNLAIDDALAAAGNRHVTVWYEALIQDPTEEVVRLQEFFERSGIPLTREDAQFPALHRTPRPPDVPDDETKIRGYAAANEDRLTEYMWHASL